jgi:hypothetical protein
VKLLSPAELETALRDIVCIRSMHCCTAASVPKAKCRHRCNSCQKLDLTGRENIPYIANQREDFLAKTFREYRDNIRCGYNGVMAARVRKRRKRRTNCRSRLLHCAPSLITNYGWPGAKKPGPMWGPVSVIAGVGAGNSSRGEHAAHRRFWEDSSGATASQQYAKQALTRQR